MLRLHVSVCVQQMRIYNQPRQQYGVYLLSLFMEDTLLLAGRM